MLIYVYAYTILRDAFPCSLDPWALQIKVYTFGMSTSQAELPQTVKIIICAECYSDDQGEAPSGRKFWLHGPLESRLKVRCCNSMYYSMYATTQDTHAPYGSALHRRCTCGCTDRSRLACNRYDRLVATDHLTSTYGLYNLQSLQMSILLTFAMSP